MIHRAEYIALCRDVERMQTCTVTQARRVRVHTCRVLMMPAISCVAILVAAVAAASPDELACSLNGVRIAGKCKCYPPWTSANCAKLDILPKKKGSLPAYGFAPNVTSWGGNVIKNDAGTYDMWVSEMVGGCGLKTWGKNSRIVHATADSMDSSFTFTEETLPVWAHNAAPVRAPKTHTQCPGCYYLFHIGSGKYTSPPEQCNTTGSPSSEPALNTKHSQAPPPPPGPCVGLCTNTSGLVHRSRGPNGPWEPLPSIPHEGCNNPAPAFAKNGTLFVLCSSSSIWRTDEPTDGTAWELVSRIDLNDSPWTGGKPSRYLQVEDPYLYMDQHEHWHLLVHLYDYRDGYPKNPNQTMPILVSGHAYSTDLRTLHYSVSPTESLGESQPFDPWVIYDDGTRQNFSTFERPHLVFNEDGVPTHSVHGASPVWDQYGSGHPCEVCPARPGTDHSCVVCKSSTDYSWTYTLVQALNVPDNRAALA